MLTIGQKVLVGWQVPGGEFRTYAKGTVAGPMIDVGDDDPSAPIPAYPVKLTELVDGPALRNDLGMTGKVGDTLSAVIETSELIQDNN